MIKKYHIHLAYNGLPNGCKTILKEICNVSLKKQENA